MRIETAFDHKEMKASLSADLESGHEDHALLTGLKRWDERMMMEAGGLYTLAGATNHGKSSLGLAVAMKASENNVGVSYISLEDKFRLMRSRVIGWQAGINPRLLRRNDLHDDQRAWVQAGGITRLPDLDFVCRTDLRRIDDIVENYREAREMGHKLMVVDYIQAISGGTGDRRIQIGDFCGRIRDAGDQNGIATLLISQIRRRERDTDKPTLSMLKEAGELENASDAVALIFRDDEAQKTDVWVAKHKDDFDAAPWQMRRNMNWGGALVEIAAGGRSLQPHKQHPWESDDDQTDSKYRSEVEQRRHEQGSSGEPERPDVERAPENGADPYPAGWATRHDLR